jgi:hypothetical protein
MLLEGRDWLETGGGRPACDMKSAHPFAGDRIRAWPEEGAILEWEQTSCWPLDAN